ncbi:hypothetical protein HD806DRAFT_530240 [Xylariaceae sp. AK1471]|nr:hypothetical protein HD806DRAFT_530240 [Xylariaceae sp. AK1471]
MHQPWLFGAAAINNNATLAAEIDLEVQVVGILFHDFGGTSDLNPPGAQTCYGDKRFEIDGAIGTTNFIKENGPEVEWDEIRLQLVWDAISLQGTPSISEDKQPSVRFIAESISMNDPRVLTQRSRRRITRASLKRIFPRILER